MILLKLEVVFQGNTSDRFSAAGKNELKKLKGASASERDQPAAGSG